MTEITAAVPLDADGQEFVDGAEYLDAFGDTWRYLGGIEQLLHVKRANEEPPGTDGYRCCEDAAFVARNYGPMTKVTEVAR